MWDLNGMDDRQYDIVFFDASQHLLSLKHGAVGGERGAGFVVDFTVTFEEGGPQVSDEVHPVQTCSRALSLSSSHTH